ncbi:Electron transfer flavoprotein-ubiquinone oxidoreductase, mitochondrial [Trametes pubescens]|uniref:Electron transfer flavoprotein-ubiquinone oxidoreductase n=1 Tax=Trametes pubescens TaxID=154538 RepID=A0A1M2W4J1_TRAPU|nr:Electron transfer flavoprotein-ubiquinone oxidoreductase, mitochondrial [Trametes pubescens]
MAAFSFSFPCGVLIGCSAGFVNIAKIKGTHSAMKSGMLAADTAFYAVASEAISEDEPADVHAYETSLHKSWVHDDLYEVRNVRPSSNTSLGVLDGVMYSRLDTLLLRGRTSGPSYPPFQTLLSTDLLTSVALTDTNHAEDQPVHLRVRRYLPPGGGEAVGVECSESAKGLATERWTEDASVRREHVHARIDEHAGLLGRGRPAQVNEYVDAEGAEAKTTDIAEQAS